MATITSTLPEIDKLVKLLICPLSGKLFNVPVIDDILNDENVYEQNELIKKYNRVGKIVSVLQNFINIFLDAYPEYKNLQYYVEPIIRDMTHQMNQEEIKDFISNGQYADLLKYTKFDLELFDIIQITSFTGSADEKVINHIINN
jgi:hypothetical protein